MWFLFKDISTNGTELNGEKVEKDKSVELEDHSRIVLAPGKKNAVSLKFSVFKKKENKSLKRAKTETNATFIDDDVQEEEDSGAPLLKKSGSGKEDEDVYSSHFTCVICQSIFHNPVSLIPCLHTYW